MPSEATELKERIEAKRKRIEARVHELKADGDAAAREKAESLESQLDDITETVRDGYENLSDQAMSKLNDWLKD